MPQSTVDSEPCLQIGAIYLLLFILDRDVSKGFHWALYHHRTPMGGYKFNVKDIGMNWICDSGSNNGIMRSFGLDGALRIGTCNPAEADTLAWIDHVCLTQPPAPYDKFTCRTWTMHCVRGLIKQGYVQCDDPDALEQEALTWGALHHERAHDGVMLRPVENSKSCKF